MAQNENKQMTKISPRRMQHLIHGGAKIVEFQKFLGIPGSQMRMTIVIWKDSQVFYTIQEKPFPFMIDVGGSCFCAPERECIQPISYPL